MVDNAIWSFGENYPSNWIILTIVFSVIFGLGLVLPKDNTIEKRKIYIIGLVSICVILLFSFSTEDFKLLYISILFCLGFLYTVKSGISNSLEVGVRNSIMATYTGLFICVLAYFLNGPKAGQSLEASMFAGFIDISSGIIVGLNSSRKSKGINKRV